jgi:uncharacterized protein YeaO (DUF488 family)
VIKRVYDAAKPDDGFRILVDRLWPRGLSKAKLKMDLWMRDIGPSDDLRRWFSHDPEKWLEFKRRYFKELNGKQEMIEQIRNRAKHDKVTLLYSAKDELHNQAVALKEYLES